MTPTRRIDLSDGIEMLFGEVSYAAVTLQI